MLTIRSIATHPLTFASGAPVRAASAVTRLHDHWVIAQDDATHAAVWRGGPAEPLRLFPSIQGADTFSAADGTKRLKPDVESACTLPVTGSEGALLLGSGSLDTRMRAALVTRGRDGWQVTAAELAPLYERVADALGIAMDLLNLEGACLVGSALRWFQRGHAAGAASAAVDVAFPALLAAVTGDGSSDAVAVTAAATYDLGEVAGVPLAITDAAALPDGRIVVSAAAEDAPDPVADGPIVGSAIALIDHHGVVDVMQLPRAPDGPVWKVEGLGFRSMTGNRIRLLAVVDQDDPDESSVALSMSLDLS